MERIILSFCLIKSHLSNFIIYMIRRVFEDNFYLFTYSNKLLVDLVKGHLSNFIIYMIKMLFECNFAYSNILISFY